ncbi:MAG: hypothetical protein V3W34_14860 [Phycisphaerae bacterium]
MKLAILSEAQADEAAIRILAEGILGEKVESVAGRRIRGWQGVLNILPVVVLDAHYRTDADGVIVVVDSDNTPVHHPTHDKPGGQNDLCRLCILRQKIGEVQAHLHPIPAREPLRIAVGVAIPAIEAWYLCGRDTRVRESVWARYLDGQPRPYTKNELKQLIYGTDQPPLQAAVARATEEARRLVEILTSLEERFPVGFGSLANAIRGW